MIEYDNHEKINKDWFNFNIGIPIKMYSYNETTAYDILTVDQKILRNCIFTPFTFNNCIIDFKLATIDDFDTETQFYSKSGISIYDLDFSLTLKDIATYSMTHKKNYIPDIVIMLSILYNITLIIGSVRNSAYLFDFSKDITNPTPNRLDNSNTSKNYTRIYCGNTIIVIDLKTGNLEINTKNEVTLNTEKLVLKANKINIGDKNSTHKVILGDIMENLFNTHTHSSPAGGTTGVPVKLLDGSELSTVTKLNK